MPLVDPSLEGWKVNRINLGPPYKVDFIERTYGALKGKKLFPHVADEIGTVALSGPGGAVWCATVEQAQALCDAANAGKLEKV